MESQGKGASVYEQKRAMGTASILAIGTANRSNVVDQSTFPDFYFRVTNSDHKQDLKDKFRRISALVSSNKEVKPRLAGFNNRDGTLDIWDDSRPCFELFGNDDDKLNPKSYDPFANKGRFSSNQENEIVPDSVPPSPVFTYSQRFRNKAYDKQLPQSMERIPHTQVPSPREANDKPLPQSKERIPQTQDDAQLICSESKKETKLNEALECFTVNKSSIHQVQVISSESKQKTILKEAPDWFVLNKDNKTRPVSVENFYVAMKQK